MATRSGGFGTPSIGALGGASNFDQLYGSQWWQEPQAQTAARPQVTIQPPKQNDGESAAEYDARYREWLRSTEGMQYQNQVAAAGGASPVTNVKTTLPDGSTRWDAGGGNYVTQPAGGGNLSFYDQTGAEVGAPVNNPDGSYTRTFPDGAAMRVYPDGRREWIVEGKVFQLEPVNRTAMGTPKSWLLEPGATTKSGIPIPQGVIDESNRQSEMAALAQHGGAGWMQLSQQQRQAILDGNKARFEAGTAALFTEGKTAAGMTPQTIGQSDWGQAAAASQQSQREAATAKYARTASGAVDYTRLADGRPSGLDKQGRAPYMNDGSIDPLYQGPAVPGAVGVPDTNHTPEWSAAHQAAAEAPPGADAEGNLVPNTWNAGWHLGDTPPAQYLPVDATRAAELGAANQKLDGYIANLERALSVEKDPAKQKSIQEKLDTYRARKQEYSSTITQGTQNPAWTAAPGPAVSWTGAGGNATTNPQFGEARNGQDQTPYPSTWSVAGGSVAQGQMPAPAPKADYTKQASTIMGYISNLTAARNATTDQKKKDEFDKKIAEWSRRRSEYLSR